MSSPIYTFFALTVRDPIDDNGYDKGAGLLMGEAVLLNHELEGTGYMPDGWWGDVRPNDAPIAPHTEEDLLSEFREDWSVSRTDEPGLSVVVPYLDDSWSVSDITLNIIRDYFSAIVEGRLVATVENLSSGESIQISNDSLDQLLSELHLEPASSMRLSRDIEMVRWIESQEATPLTLDWTGAPKWSSVSHDDEEMDALRNQFETDGRVFVRIPVNVSRTDGSVNKTAHLEMVLVDEPESHEYPLFIRDGIKVSQAGREPLNTVRAIVLIREQELTQMVGDAENPAHVDWSDQTKSFKDRYTYGSSWLKFIRYAPREIVRRMRGSDPERDLAVAAAYFAAPGSSRHGEVGGGADPGEGSGGGKGGTKPTKPTGGGRGKRSSPIKIQKLPNGFQIELTDTGKAAKVAEIQGKVAYDVRSGDAFKKWTSDDFVLDPTHAKSGIRIVCEGGDYSLVRNEFHINVDDAEALRFEVTGFDANRDLKVIGDEV